MAVNFSKNQDEIIKAWREVVDSSETPKWALFGYEGTTNNIKLTATGSGGLDELVQEFNCSLIQYAFCRVLEKSLGVNKLVLINWQGDSSPLSRKGLCASHVGDVSNYFKGCTQTITIRNDDEATKDYLMEQIVKTSASRINLRQQQQQQRATLEDVPSVGSTYKKADVSSDITSDRKSFWQRQEEEEKERLAEEKKRAAEKQAQFERERKLKEESETKKLAETIKQRDLLIEATRQSNQPSSTASQPSSAPTSTDTTDDDSRVGRRSELIRLERNQETQSLISKGLIKNKRAIFEQAQQQQQQDHQPTLVRRASGAMIAQRVNTFKSLDNSNISSSSNNSSNEKIQTSKVVQNLSNGFAKKVDINGDEPNANDSAKVTSPVKKEIEPIKLTNDEESMVSTVEADDKPSTPIKNTKVEEDKTVDAAVVDSVVLSPVENSDIVESSKSPDVNGNDEGKMISTKENNEIELANNEELITNGKSDIKAVALYDYQAADNTEISFDPEDVIGSILKVDPGWWHGIILSGRFKGQAGLFPANYVQEI